MNFIRKILKSESIKYDDTFDVHDILNNLTDDNYSFPHNTDITSIRENVRNSLLSFQNISSEDIKTLQSKLFAYHFVDDISHITKGKYVRWINKDDSFYLLKYGGIVMDIKFLNNGIHIVIFNKNLNRVIQFKYDNVLLFQKLSIEEELILVARDIAQDIP